MTVKIKEHPNPHLLFLMEETDLKYLQSCQHDFFENRNRMSKNLYFGSKICNAL